MALLLHEKTRLRVSHHTQALFFYAAETRIFNERGGCFCGGGFAIIMVCPYANIVYGYTHYVIVFLNMLTNIFDYFITN